MSEIKTLKAIDELANRYSEVDLDDWYYDGIFGSARIKGNPYEEQIWSVLSELRYVDNITAMELKLAEDMDEDYDILDIQYIEIRPKKSLDEYKTILKEMKE